MAQNPTVTIVVIGTVTRIILGISIQSLIGSAIAGMVFAATTQDHFGLATASRYLGIRARFTIYRITLHYYDYYGPKTVLAPNTTLLTTAIVKEKRADTRIAARSSVTR
jgi:hypothetical protein